MCWQYSEWCTGEDLTLGGYVFIGSTRSSFCIISLFFCCYFGSSPQGWHINPLLVNIQQPDCINGHFRVREKGEWQLVTVTVSQVWLLAAWLCERGGRMIAVSWVQGRNLKNNKTLRIINLYWTKVFESITFLNQGGTAHIWKRLAHGWKKILCLLEVCKITCFHRKIFMINENIFLSVRD